MSFGVIVGVLIVAYIIGKICEYAIAADGAEKAKARAEAAIPIERQKEQDFQKKLNELDIDKSKTDIVTVVQVMGGLVVYYSYYIWVKDNALHLFPSTRQVRDSAVGHGLVIEDWKIVHTVIPIEKILCYRQIGEVYTTVQGSGGESTYSFITGAHGKINPIKITSTVHDTRTTQLFYDNGTKDVIWVFQHGDYYKFKKLLPEKDYDVVNAITAASIEADREKTQTVQQRIATLKSLFEQNLITEEEFEKKKAEILSEI